MKGFSYYVMTAVISQFVKHFDCNEFARTVAEKIKENTNESVTVNECKKSGMVLRAKRDNGISEKDINDGIVDAMQELISNDTNDFEIDIVEKYEFEFSVDQIDASFVDGTMDIKKKGRDIYIEIDV